METFMEILGGALRSNDVNVMEQKQGLFLVLQSVKYQVLLMKIIYCSYFVSTYNNTLVKVC